MTNRERFNNIMRFKPVDRLPRIEWATWWDKTIERWEAEGLSVPPHPTLSKWTAIQSHLGLDLQLQTWFGFSTKETPRPAGHGLPVINNDDEYTRILPTLYPEHLPASAETLSAFKALDATGEGITWATVEGPFWGPRTLLGIEQHLYAFYDQPELLHRINTDLVQYNIRKLTQLCEHYVPAFITIAEDMSYNNGPMLSEAQFDEFLLPYYTKLVRFLNERDILCFIDSDGDVTKMVPWFERAGIQGVLPLERQAGVDVNVLQARHPKFLLLGHYDKMVMPHGEEAMRGEFERLLPAMRRGGFIPSVDHQTPPGVSLENYRIYLRLLNEYTIRAAQ